MKKSKGTITDYELIDYGFGRKLERFGDFVLDRPEVLASSSAFFSKKDWLGQPDARFVEESKNNGQWHNFSSIPESWVFQFASNNLSWKIKLGLSPFKHIGVFPEQADHWKYLMKRVKGGDRVLNLFGYTGAASMSAAVAGGEVFHVDSSKSIVKKAAENAALNQIKDIHWVVEDALTFAQKEVKRGNKYNFIIMDPPVYGRSKKGKHWRLEGFLPSLMESATNLLSENGVLILNTYSPKIQLADMSSIAKSLHLDQEKAGWLSVSSGKRKLNLSRFIICRFP